jgi:hypothetical protein
MGLITLIKKQALHNLGKSWAITYVLSKYMNFLLLNQKI